MKLKKECCYETVAHVTLWNEKGAYKRPVDHRGCTHITTCPCWQMDKISLNLQHS